MPTTLSRSFAELRFASLVAWAYTFIVVLTSEAVKCTDSELSLKIPEREHGEIVDMVLAMQRSKIQVQQQNDYLKNYTPPERNRGR